MNKKKYVNAYNSKNGLTETRKRSLFSLKKSVFLLLLWLVVISLLSCGNKQGNQASGIPAADQINQAKNEQNLLLFFLNPGGRPCIMQDGILSSIQDQVVDKIRYVYIDVHDNQNKPLFYQYGVRALPTIILLDKAGNIVQRFQPGIIGEQPLLKAINEI